MTIVNLERFDINIYEYRPFVGSTYVSFGDVKVNFKGREITLDDKLSRKEAIVNMQNNHNMCFKWAVMRALNPIDKNKHRITKELRKQAEEYDIRIDGYHYTRNSELIRKTAIFSTCLGA